MALLLVESLWTSSRISVPRWWDIEQYLDCGGSDHLIAERNNSFLFVWKMLCQSSEFSNLLIFSLSQEFFFLCNSYLQLQSFPDLRSTMWTGEKTPALGGSLLFKERSSGYRYGTCQWEWSVLNQSRNYFSPLTGGSLKSHRIGFWPLTGDPKSQRTRVKDSTLNCLFFLSWKLLVLWIPVINLSRFFWFWQFSENWNWILEIFKNSELYFLLILYFFKKPEPNVIWFLKTIWFLKL